MGQIYEASIRGVERDIRGRLKAAEQSLAALKNQHSWFADDHRKLIKVYESMIVAMEENR